MKNLICKKLFLDLFTPKRFAMMAGEKEAMTEMADTRLGEINNEAINDEKYAAIRTSAESDLNNTKKVILDTRQMAHDAEKAVDDKKLADAKPAEKAKITKENKAKEDAWKLSFGQMQADFEAGKVQALAKLDKTYDELKAKKTKNAEALAEGISGVLLDKKLEKRQKNVDGDVAEMMGSANFYFEEQELATYTEGKDGKPVAVRDKDITLDGNDMKVVVGEMVKAIYMTQGPEAAKAKVEELRKMADKNSKVGFLPNAVWEADVDMSMIDKVFGKDGKGALSSVLEKFYLDPDKMDDKKIAQLLGSAAGNLKAAEALFSKDKGTDKYYSAYEKAVGEALKKGETPPTVNDWAKKNAPEALVEEKKDPNKLIDEVLAGMKRPEGVTVGVGATAGVSKSKTTEDYIDDAAEYLPGYTLGKYLAKKGLGTEAAKKGLETVGLASENMRAEAEFAKRKEAIRTVLQGVLAAEPDSSKWDVLIKKALTGITKPEGDAGKDYKLDMNALNTFDYSKMTAGREIYGDAKLPPSAQRVLSGMIMGGDITYGGKTVEITTDGKTATGDYMDGYKKFVGNQLSGAEGKEGALFKRLEKLKQTRRDQMDEITETDPEKIAQRKKEIMKANDEAVAKLIRDELTPAKFEATLPKPEPKKEEPPKEDDKGKGKGKKAPGGSGGGKAPESKGGGDAAPKKPADKKPDAPAGDKGKKPADTPTDKPIATSDKPPVVSGKPGAPVVKVEVPVVPVDAVVDVVIPPEVKQQVTKIVTDVAGMPRPLGGWKPADAQATIDAGIAALPGGLVKPGDKPLRFKSSRMEIEVSADDKGKYQGKIVAASPDVKKKYGFGDDVPVIAPPEKPDKKMAGKKDKSSEAAT